MGKAFEAEMSASRMAGSGPMQAPVGEDTYNHFPSHPPPSAGSQRDNRDHYNHATLHAGPTDSERNTYHTLAHPALGPKEPAYSEWGPRTTPAPVGKPETRPALPLPPNLEKVSASLQTLSSLALKMDRAILGNGFDERMAQDLIGQGFQFVGLCFANRTAV